MNCDLEPELTPLVLIKFCIFSTKVSHLLFDSDKSLFTFFNESNFVCNSSFLITYRSNCAFIALIFIELYVLKKAKLKDDTVKVWKNRVVLFIFCFC